MAAKRNLISTHVAVTKNNLFIYIYAVRQGKNISTVLDGEQGECWGGGGGSGGGLITT